jgi:hypothetical protein
MSLVELQRAAVELCCGPEPSAQQVAVLGDERIWRLYRELIRKRLLGELKIALPRTYAAAGAEAFARAFDHHMRVEPPRTRFFHALVGGFAHGAAPLFRDDASLPPYLGDLCEYEAAVWTVSDLDDRLALAPATEFAFDRPALLAPALRLLALRFAVHAPPGNGGYESGEFHLCIHRRPEEKKSKTWTLNAVTFALMRRFESAPQESVSEAVQHVAGERGIAVDESFLDGLCTVLADFIERGILLGPR